MLVHARVEGICTGVEPKAMYVDNRPTNTQEVRDGIPLWSVTVISENERVGQRITVPARTMPNLPFGERIVFPDAEISVAWARANEVRLADEYAAAEDFE